MGDLYSNLFINVKTLEQIKKNATVIIDTNVLLLGYQWKNITFESVLEVLKQLSNEERLKIPAHVIREFAKNRPGKITEMSKQIHTVMSTLEKGSNVGKSLEEVIPALSIVEGYHNDIIILEENYNKRIQELNAARKEYINGLKQLQQKLSDYIDHDLILSSYKEIIEKSYFAPEGLMDKERLKEEWQHRVENKIPPGYMDKAKKENQYGDLIVWDHIRQISNDVIFVTTDVKGDWVHTANDEVMGARRELVEEFYSRENYKGYTFKILTPLQFITLFSNRVVEQEIKDDLNQEIKEGITKSKKLLEQKLLEQLRNGFESNTGETDFIGNIYNEDGEKNEALAAEMKNEMQRLRKIVDKEEPIFQINLHKIEKQLKVIFEIATYDKYIKAAREYISLLESIVLKRDGPSFIKHASQVEQLANELSNIIDYYA
ncbi:PIN-like domain-containing protein [Bacillus cereus group sp. MYBK95-2]|uniref:PIN-like domain-containing protein n=1 Tax=Bacillus cereus group sp. MYBK95-2 TaxID=3450599 RepID=UPI003F7ACCCF